MSGPACFDGEVRICSVETLPVASSVCICENVFQTTFRNDRRLWIRVLRFDEGSREALKRVDAFRKRVEDFCPIVSLVPTAVLVKESAGVLCTRRAIGSPAYGPCTPLSEWKEDRRRLEEEHLQAIAGIVAVRWLTRTLPNDLVELEKSIHITDEDSFLDTFFTWGNDGRKDGEDDPSVEFLDAFRAWMISQGLIDRSETMKGKVFAHVRGYVINLRRLEELKSC
jgi:hypothetical protein